MVLIDGARYGFLDPLLGAGSVAVARAALGEVRYWRDAEGVRHPIDLGPYVLAGRLAVEDATTAEMVALLKRIRSSALGAGELESLALVLARGERFCTADKAARRAMGELGVEDRWVALEELLGELEPPIAAPEEKYRRGAR
jgi:hypothetical protein